MNVLVVSIPRSGHHYLIRAAARVLGQLSYCEAYHCVDENGSPLRCNYAGQRPALNCANGKAVVKNHDFHLNLEKSQARIVVLYRRNWFGLLKSWFQLESGRQVSREKLAFGVFILSRLAYVAGFLAKWVRASDEHLLCLEYEELASREKLLAALSFMAGRNLTESERLSLDYVEQFSPRTTGFFEAAISGLLKSLSIPLLGRKHILSRKIQAESRDRWKAYRRFMKPSPAMDI